MSAPFTIMCFSWNADGLRLCETMSQNKGDAERKGFKAFISRKKPCLASDFFEEIRININDRHPSLVVMTTQDEDTKDTYFHSDLLPVSMSEIGYSLLKRDKLDKIGEMASGIVPRRVITGTPSGSALRMSIYADYNIIQGLKSEEKILDNFFGNNGQAETTCDQGDRISGAIVSYVWHENYGKFAFIAAHLPSGITSLKIGNNLSYESYRSASKSSNILCLLKIYNQFISSLPMESRPDHIFLLGDLNYEIVIPNKTHLEIISELSANISAAKLKELQKYDELKKAMEEVPLLGFKEGVSSEGPLFVPTWKLARGRPDTCSPGNGATKIDTTCFAGSSETIRGIGWHDRILYKEMMTSNYIAHCTGYNRIDVKNMHQSTHAGVTSFFEMLPVS